MGDRFELDITLSKPVPTRRDSEIRALIQQNSTNNGITKDHSNSNNQLPEHSVNMGVLPLAMRY